MIREETMAFFKLEFVHSPCTVYAHLVDNLCAVHRIFPIVDCAIIIHTLIGRSLLIPNSTA